MDRISLSPDRTILLTAMLLLFFSSSIFGQTKSETPLSSKITPMTSADLKKKVGDSAFNDPRLYDKDGLLVDSAEAIRKLKSLEYHVVWRSNNAGMYRKFIIKVDTIAREKVDLLAKDLFKPKNPKLHEGVALDLKPLKRHIQRENLTGKAVLLIFWCDGCYSRNPNAYARVNEVLLKHKDPTKLEILTITPHNIDQASKGLAKNPIINTSHIIDARTVIADYETENRPTIVLTDKSHKIVFSVVNNVDMTARTLDKLLKQIL